MPKINTEDYSIDELREVFGLDEKFTISMLNDKIEDFKSNKNNPDLINFINESYEKLKKSTVDDKLQYESELKDIIKYSPRVSRFINIDSQFRENESKEVSPLSSSTNFNFELNETLTNVVSMNIYSVELPYSWYTFAEDYGTNKIKVNDQIYDISSGNYSPNELVSELNRVLAGESLNMELDLISGKLSIKNNSGSSKIIIFYDDVDITNSKTNRNLGWLLGFRNISLTLNVGETIRADALIDVWGPKYLLLSLDDFNNNQVGKHMIGIARKSHQLETPVYYNDNNFVKTGTTKSDFKYESVSKKKSLTNAQISTFNSIVNDKTNVINDQFLSPLTTNILAKIPITNDNNWNSSFSKPLIQFSTQLQKNERHYFGPININKMSVKLTDDKGTVINLNNTDWSFSLVTKHEHYHTYNTKT